MLRRCSRSLPISLADGTCKPCADNVKKRACAPAAHTGRILHEPAHSAFSRPRGATARYGTRLGRRRRRGHGPLETGRTLQRAAPARDILGRRRSRHERHARPAARPHRGGAEPLARRGRSRAPLRGRGAQPGRIQRPGRRRCAQPPKRAGNHRPARPPHGRGRSSGAGRHGRHPQAGTAAGGSPGGRKPGRNRGPSAHRQLQYPRAVCGQRGQSRRDPGLQQGQRTQGARPGAQGQRGLSQSPAGRGQ